MTLMLSFKNYRERLNQVLASFDWTPVGTLAEDLLGCWRDGRRVFICGNGGSAANALHLANDLHYGAGQEGRVPGLRAQALVGNISVATCLANDCGYDEIFARQLMVEGEPGDLLIAFSGSGNSSNILRAIEQAKEMRMRTYAILGFSGGKAKAMVDVPIHFPVNDMQISEDTQVVIGHMLMQWLCQNCIGVSDHKEAVA